MRSEVHREVARLMAQMRRLCSTAANKQLAVVGSSLNEYMVLMRLANEKSEEAPQFELAYDAAIDPAAVSRLVRDMTHNGLVTSRVDQTDKRQRFVRLTSKGRTLMKTLSPVVDSALEPYMAGLSEPEELEFLRLLRKAHDTVLAVANDGQQSTSEPEGRGVAREASQGKPRRAARR
jgi:DNA-binding MarR family transcriptional regulator